MPVPSSLNDLSTTPSLNSPAGSESPALVDDYLRTHAAFIKQVDNAAAKSATLAASGGSALVGYLPGGTSAVATTVQSKLREFVSVKDFGAVGDGVADDTAAVQAAVTHCFTNGDQLYWPDGTYLTTASIANFHGIQHSGSGIVQRGADSWQISNTGANRNILYVSPSGTGDGLSSSQAMTLENAVSALKLIGPFLRGLWRIQMAAGTYPALVQFFQDIIPPTASRLEIRGPDVSGGVPTAIIDAGGVGGSAVGFYAIGQGVQLAFKDVKFINAVNGSTASGLVLDRQAGASLENVHTDNTQWAGVNFNEASDCVVIGGRFENSATYGIRCYGGTIASIGFATSARPQFVNCVGAGVILQGHSYGHVDYSDFNNCGIGINLVLQSHAAALNNTYTNCTTGWQTETFSTIRSESYTITGGTRRARSRWGQNTSNVDTFFYENQFHEASGVNGCSSFGYTDWVVPTVKYQYSNNGTTTGTSLSNYAAATALWESNANTVLAIASPSANFSSLWLGSGTTHNAAEVRGTPTDVQLRVSGTTGLQVGSASIRAGADNTQSCGTAGVRWTTVFAATGTINTSDAREKQQIRELSEQERAVAVRLKSLIRVFKFNDAVEKKGDGARVHFGVIAQDVKAAFEAEGLVAEDYAVLCYDEWPETPEERDEEGNVTQEYRPAGNRYGVRYEELLAFIIGAM